MSTHALSSGLGVHLTVSQARSRDFGIQDTDVPSTACVLVDSE
jgi:hypothetical protein